MATNTKYGRLSIKHYETLLFVSLDHLRQVIVSLRIHASIYICECFKRIDKDSVYIILMTIKIVLAIDI